MDKNSPDYGSNDSTLTFADEARPVTRRPPAAAAAPSRRSHDTPTEPTLPERDAHTWELFAMRSRVAQARSEYTAQFGGRRERLRRALWVFGPPAAPTALSLWLTRHAPEPEQLLLGASVYAMGVLCGATIARMLPAGLARARLRSLDNQLAERERRAGKDTRRG